jgi:hypothetical protein
MAGFEVCRNVVLRKYDLSADTKVSNSTCGDELIDLRRTDANPPGGCGDGQHRPWHIR